MHINATCIIQIINFWISYAMLHKLLLKPFVRLIYQKKAARETLINGLKNKEHQLLQLQEEKKQHLESFRNYVQTHYTPKVAKIEAIPGEVFYTPDQHTIENLITHEKNLLFQRVPECLLK